MRIAVGNDHAGLALKRALLPHLEELGLQTINLGVDSEAPADYPDMAEAVARAVVGGEAELGLLICGTGLGVCMAANKIVGARAATCCFEYHAVMARRHNHANICCLGARVTGEELAKAIVTAFVRTPEDTAERHVRRRRKIEALEER
ncbi:MAG: ribose 5-phosphate isomerase B [Armatimonadota bacterium]